MIIIKEKYKDTYIVYIDDSIDNVEVLPPGCVLALSFDWIEEDTINSLVRIHDRYMGRFDV